MSRTGELIRVKCQPYTARVHAGEQAALADHCGLAGVVLGKAVGERGMKVALRGILKTAVTRRPSSTIDSMLRTVRLHQRWFDARQRHPGPKRRLPGFARTLEH